jgi:hypothetical protein
VITEDDNPDALRDVPLIGRISVEGGRIALRMFRLSAHAQAADAIVAEIGIDKAERQHLPIVAWFTSDMKLLGAHIRRLPELHDEMQQRQRDWVTAHPDVKDASEPIDKMTPVTRTRISQAMYALTSEQRLFWGRKTVLAWRGILAGLPAAKPADGAPSNGVSAPASQPAEPRKTPAPAPAPTPSKGGGVKPS